MWDMRTSTCTSTSLKETIAVSAFHQTCKLVIQNVIMRPNYFLSIVIDTGVTKLEFNPFQLFTVDKFDEALYLYL